MSTRYVTDDEIGGFGECIKEVKAFRSRNCIRDSLWGLGINRDTQVTKYTYHNERTQPRFLSSPGLWAPDKCKSSPGSSYPKEILV